MLTPGGKDGIENDNGASFNARSIALEFRLHRKTPLALSFDYETSPTLREGCLKKLRRELDRGLYTIGKETHVLEQR
jgi:hypothetical protein